MTPSLDLVDDFRLSPDQHAELRALLGRCFPDEDYMRTRSYYKQLSTRRLLARDGDLLVGHLGLEHRAMRLPTGPAQVFGVVDVAVLPERQGQGIASRLLEQVEALGRTHGIEFVVLFASDDRLYARNGYRHPANELSWLMIHEHETLGVAREPVEELRVKALGDRPWPDGHVDLLGHLF
ncbi:MAG TPA: GNAT family N-acetyltransferase [Pseudomonadales bacterium]|nr:GNAT family N-acetyltransferase [Pseudomonadales bacterium]